MKAKIDHNIICIPPYISTNWSQVSFLQSEENSETKRFTLLLHLSNGQMISIPNLDASVVDIAFAAHLKHLEQRKTAFAGGDPASHFRIGLPGIENVADILQHDLAKSDTPDLPQEVLDRISSMAKMITGGELEAFPKPEPHCNCMHCQLARAVHGSNESEEEIINDEELSFRDWDIHEDGEDLYLVVNPIDPEEKYHVYLGTPVGCTCGEPNCEHIKAVLSS